MKDDADLLVVEDEPVLVGAIRKVCESEGLSVDGAASTEEGLAKLSANHYRIVVSDLMLPGIGGLGILDVARRERPETPVMVITGYATRNRIVKCFEHGAFDVVPKPFDMQELLASVRRALGFSTLGPSERHSDALESQAGQPSALDGSAGLFSLGQHAWVRFSPDGSAEIGVAESFLGVDDEVREVRFPPIDFEALQANECASIATANGLVHRVWAPLSGKIVKTNPSWTGVAGGTRTPIERWMMLIVPTDLENELDTLTRR